MQAEKTLAGIKNFFMYYKVCSIKKNNGKSIYVHYLSISFGATKSAMYNCVGERPSRLLVHITFE